MSKLGHHYRDEGKHMAEAKDLNVKVRIKFDTEYPTVPSSIEERTQALKDARALLTSSSNGGGIVGAFAGVQQTGVPPTGDGTLALMRLAEYMVVGHDYLDTHPPTADNEPSKKERRRAVKEIRKIVQEEVEEEFDKRQQVGAGTLIVPRVLIEEEDGSFTDTNPEDDEEGKGDE